MTADEKYKAALQLYETTDKTISQISKECGVGRGAFAAYIQRKHRGMMLQRNGLEGNPDDKIRKNNGQRPETHQKYREAIRACDSEEYIHLNISQIARLFHLNGTALANQLRAHYPDIIPRREAERQRRGLADNTHRGVRRSAAEAYGEAIEMLRNTNYTVEQVARLCNVSFTGLRQHILFYHKDIARLRGLRRSEGKAMPKTGALAGNGKMRVVSDDVRKKYAEGVELYRTTSLTVAEIARRIGVNVNSFRHHLSTWHRRLMFERRGAELPGEASDRAPFGDAKRYSKSTVEKYAEAIRALETTDTTAEAVARQYGFTPGVFRAYLKEHNLAHLIRPSRKTKTNK